MECGEDEGRGDEDDVEKVEVLVVVGTHGTDGEHHEERHANECLRTSYQGNSRAGTGRSVLTMTAYMNLS